MFAAKDLFATRGGYNIAKSLRFRSSASAYLSRTPAAGNRKTWTYSAWVKRGALSDVYILGAGSSSTNYFGIAFSSNNLYILDYQSTAFTTNVNTAAVFRDPSAWYHIVVVLDTTQATGTNRVKMYINGAQQTLTFTTTPAQNTDLVFNSAVANYVGATQSTAITGFFDGYLSEVNFIDGQALDPSYFGQTSVTTGVWMPKKYTGTYGTNGFYLNFSDASGATATTIGKDSSGNGNNWTPTNISVAAGVTYDSMVDTPTNYDNGGNGAGNYCVLNPVNVSGGGSTITDGNLACSAASSATYGKILGSFGISSGKWYWEATVTAVGTTANIGLGDGTLPTGSGALGYYAGELGYLSNGNKYTNNTSSAYGASYTTNDVIGVAYDADAGSITFYKNNVSQGAITGLSGVKYPAFSNGGGTSTYAVNFGQRPFAYTPPSGYKALNTLNLPTPTILNGAKYMAAVTYSGTSASNTVVATSSNSGNNPLAITFQPDLVWIKSRSAATDHKLTDAVRGATKALISDTTGAETTDTNGLTAFTSTGFTVGSDSNYNNGTGPATYIAWEWLGANGTVSNTSGSITSTVSANVTAGFSVVKWTGTGATGKTIGHGLNVSPNFIIAKKRNKTEDWFVGHTGSGYGNNIGYHFHLNTTGAVTGSNDPYYFDTINSSNILGLSAGTANNGGNENGIDYIAYCWTAVAGYSAFGSYTGNGSTDGPFVYCGFRPRYVLIKRTDAASDWYIWDTTRDTYNVMSATLLADTSGAETSAASIDGLSNGFKCRSATVVNVSTGTYIYAAFAESPFNYSRGR